MKRTTDIAGRQELRRGLLILMFVLFPVGMNFLSPYLFIEAAAGGIAGGAFLAFAALLVSSLLLGRAFCGWACPGGGAQEICRAVNDRPLRGRRVDRIKYLVWVPWLGIAAWLYVRAGGIYRLEPRYMMDSWVSVDTPGRYLMYYFVLAAIMLPAVLAGRRAMCRAVCWMAPFMILGRKLRNAFRWPALVLEARAERCTGCGSCSRGCPMGLAVREMVRQSSLEDAECILCAGCADACPQQAIRLRFAAGAARRKRGRVPGAAALIALAGLGFLAAGPRLDAQTAGPDPSGAAPPGAAVERVLSPLAPRGLGGYGGPHFKATVLNGRFALFGAGPFALILRDTFGLGLDFNMPEGDAGGLYLGYAGLRAETIFLPSGRVHPSVGLLMGGGVARYHDPEDLLSPVYRTGVLVLEPEAAVAVDLFSGFRLAAGATWRLARGFHRLPGVGTADFSGPSGFIRLLYGVFPAEGKRGPSAAVPAAAGGPAGQAVEPRDGLTVTGAWNFKLTTLAGQPVLLDGGGTRLLFGRRLYLGAGGYFSHDGPKLGDDPLGCGYAGLWAEYDFRPQALLHLSAGGLVAIGGGGYIEADTSEEIYTGMLVLDPELNLSIGLTEFLRLALGVGYRLAFPFEEVPGLERRDFWGPTVSLQVRIAAW